MPPETSEAPDIACGPVLPAALADALRRQDPPALRAVLESLTGQTLPALLLYGSAARGEDHPGDIDALLLSATPATGGVWGAADGLDIDFHVVHLDALLGSDPGDWPHLVGARALWDADGRVTPWLAALPGHHPRPLRASQRLRERVWAERMLRRVEAGEPGVAQLRAAELVAMLPELRAAATGLPRGSIGAFWRALDPEGRALLLRWAEAPTREHASLRALVERVLRAG